MHMADALISPAVGGTMWLTSAGLIGFCSQKIKKTLDDRKVPLMGVLGAFIFAAQMINFSIPGTGSSGHIVGGLILASLLGPYASFIVIASVLVVQSLFFADGGLMALGCNIFNMGFFPCLIAYPLVFKKITGNTPSTMRLWVGSIIASIVGLQLGAFAVVLETVSSGISSLPFHTFLLMMLPIHLAIGFVEGLITAVVITFVWKNKPEVMEITPNTALTGTGSIRGVLAGFVIVAVLTGGILSWFASVHPDGLEWATFKTSGQEIKPSSEQGIHNSAASLQEKTALLPDYGFSTSAIKTDTNTQKPWPSIKEGRSLSGLVGGVLTLLLALSVGYALKTRKLYN